MNPLERGYEAINANSSQTVPLQGSFVQMGNTYSYTKGSNLAIISAHL